MWKKTIQAGLIFLSVILLTITAGTEQGYYALDLDMELGTGLRQEIQNFARDDIYESVKELDSRVTVTGTVQEDSFFEMVYMRLEELQQQYPDAGILCFVNMATLLDGVVDIEINNGTKTTCYLYVSSGNTFYELQGDMSLPLWHWVLQNEVFPLAVTEDGRHISERGFYFSRDFPKEPGVQTYVYFGDIVVTLYEDERILSTSGVHSEDADEEFILRYTDTDDSGNERLHVVAVHAIEALPKHEPGGKMRDYFLACYPDMVYYEAYPPEDRGSDAYYYTLQEGNTEHVYFVYDGQTYEVTDEVESDGFQYESGCLWGPATRIRRQLDYDYYESYVWEKDMQGLFWADFEEWEFHLEQDIGIGEQFVFETEKLPEEDEKEKEFRGERQMNIYRIGDAEPFQSFTVYSEMKNSFFFEDFNADGYLDLTVNEYYGANGGTASHYLWSPSQECFVKTQNRLDYYGSYSVDEESRRLFIHWHASAVSGTDFLYQWENETDCVLLKSMNYTYQKGKEIRIVRGEGADEQVLIDHVSDDGEYRKEEAGLFWDDLVWEREITDRSTGRRYRIYYAQEQYDGDEEKDGIFESHLYVVDDTLNLHNYLEWEGPSPYTEILWDSVDGMDAFIVHYEDGTETMHAAIELLQGREMDTASSEIGE